MRISNINHYYIILMRNLIITMKISTTISCSVT
nr:MAG TPA: hypothetical protein [Caudoviricetes sp.]